jgi:hypothetical protein
MDEEITGEKLYNSPKEHRENKWRSKDLNPL